MPPQVGDERCVIGRGAAVGQRHVVLEPQARMAAEQGSAERAFGFTRTERAHRPRHVGRQFAA
eukprot:7849-Eustigmatos_ZCMA.PRE.1